jgi:excisionase family DNA binding protein
MYIHTTDPMEKTANPPVVKRKFSVADVADALDLSERTVRNRIKDGELPAVKPGKEWIITRPDLAKWLGGMERVEAIFGPEDDE